MELIIGIVANSTRAFPALTNAALLKMDPAGSGGRTYPIPERTMNLSHYVSDGNIPPASLYSTLFSCTSCPCETLRIS